MHDNRISFMFGEYRITLTAFDERDPDNCDPVFMSGTRFGTVRMRRAVVDNRFFPPRVTIAESATTPQIIVPESDAQRIALWLTKYAKYHTEVIEHPNSYCEDKAEAELESRMEGMPVIHASKDCELCGCVISAEHRFCDTCKMLDTLEDDLTNIKTEQVTRIDLKYRVGAKEHGGRGWEMGTGKLIENAQDEVADLTCYLHWLSGHYETIIELSQNANAAFADGRPEDAEREVAALMKVLDGRPDRG